MRRTPAPPAVPYLRIADDLRARIAAGELRHGDRVPSTRALARQWGVALATATKALGTLTRAGVLRAEPRVGTVVVAVDRASRPPRSKRPAAREGERELTLAHVVAVALRIADAEGLAALSMRGVAGQLGIPPMSLYRHVPSKEELLRRMTDAAFAEESYAALRPAGWRACLETAARRQWALYRRRPWLAQVVTLSRPVILPSVMTHVEWALRAVDGLGLTPETMLHVHLTLYGYVQGLAWNLESERKAEAESGLTEEAWMETQAAALAAATGSGAYPTFTKVVTSFAAGYDHDLDRIFEFGLARLLDGIAALIAKSPRPHRRR